MFFLLWFSLNLFKLFCSDYTLYEIWNTWAQGQFSEEKASLGLNTTAQGQFSEEDTGVKDIINETINKYEPEIRKYEQKINEYEQEIVNKKK